MNKNIKKVFIKILIIFLMCQILYIPKVKAIGSLSEIFSSADSFLNEGKNKNSGDEQVLNTNELNVFNSNIFNIAFAIGVALSVIIGAILGCQLMWGSIETQVKAKEMITPYVIGCIVIFGAFGIWKIVMIIMSNVVGERLFV